MQARGKFLQSMVARARRSVLLIPYGWEGKRGPCVSMPGNRGLSKKELQGRGNA